MPRTAETPSDQPEPISDGKFRVLRFLHERDTLEELFYAGRLDEDPAVVQAHIDESNEDFRRHLAKKYILSEELEI